MGYRVDVKEKAVLFSNDTVKNLVLFELEFITDAPVLCRALRKSMATINDPAQLLVYSDKKHIKTSCSGLEAPTEFRVRFDSDACFTNSVCINVTIKEW